MACHVSLALNCGVPPGTATEVPLLTRQDGGSFDRILKVRFDVEGWQGAHRLARSPRGN